MPNQTKVQILLEKGVKIANPQSIDIGEDVNTDKISGNGVVIYSGCKIYGSSTFIHHNSKIGYEAPVTIHNCQIGAGVELNGGFFKEGVFLEKVKAGSGSHVREGTILEEQASIAHTVGLKQTILFPFVILGSLINFCDCCMAGGTSRKNHSEVGSSYIHFNFTPGQDKATASLIGDVPNGVMLNQPPVFLGGQGGLVGPCRLAFGTITAAGTICRKDELRPGYLIIDGIGRGMSFPFSPDLYQNIKRIFLNNVIYIANLIALMNWYRYVRYQFISDDFPVYLFDGLKEKLNMAIDERVKRLGELRDKIFYQKDIEKNISTEREVSISERQKSEFYGKWDLVKDMFNEVKNIEGDNHIRDDFIESIISQIKITGKDYITVIKGLKNQESLKGSIWLQGIVDQILNEVIKIMPSFF